MNIVWDVIIVDPKREMNLELTQEVEFAGKKFVILGISDRTDGGVEYYGEKKQ